MSKRKYCFFLAALSLVLIIPQGISSAKTQKTKLSKMNVILNAGETCKIKLKAAEKSKIKWYSSNKKIVKVKNGFIKAIKAGECIVTAKYKGKRYKCDVVVKDRNNTSNAPMPSPGLPAVKESPSICGPTLSPELPTVEESPSPSVSEPGLNDGSEMDFNFSKIKNFEDIKFDVQIDGSVVYLKIKNDSGTDITFGKEFVLEYYNNSRWETVKTKPGSCIAEILMLVKNGSEYTEQIDLSWNYEELAAGKYRITKVVRADNEGKIQSEFTIAGE